MKNKYIIGPIEGYSPTIGHLVSMLTCTRNTTLRIVESLTIGQLDYLYDEESNSIGALLKHIAFCDLYYQVLTFENRNIVESPSEMDGWYSAMNLGEEARKEIRGNDLNYYKECLSSVREKTLNEFKKLDDKWLFNEIIFPGSEVPVNNYYLWYHVFEDEINHRGQISWLKKRIKTK